LWDTGPNNHWRNDPVRASPDQPGCLCGCWQGSPWPCVAAWPMALVTTSNGSLGAAAQTSAGGVPEPDISADSHRDIWLFSESVACVADTARSVPARPACGLGPPWAPGSISLGRPTEADIAAAAGIPGYLLPPSPSLGATPAAASRGGLSGQVQPRGLYPHPALAFGGASWVSPRIAAEIPGYAMPQ